MADQSSIQPFNEFRDSLSSVSYKELERRSDVRTEGVETFEAMRQYLMERYDGVDVQHSFLEGGGQIVDCVPIAQQPSLKDSDEEIMDPPSVALEPTETDPVSPDPTEEHRQPPEPQLHPDYRDRLGNQMWCPPGTIPMVRITLEQLLPFKDMNQFLLAHAGGSKRWAAASEHVNSLGGSSYVNVWRPQVFGVQNSASQQWYATAPEPFVTYQSVECGWRVGTPSPPFDGNPRLFVYYTPDNHVSGCYNLLCPGSGFRQRGSTAVLGGTLTVSQSGGNQYDYVMGFFLTGGAWWFNFNGDWIGYYPTSLFGSGRLASSAGSVGFGGETSGIGAFPAMGSGVFPLAGFGRAAYQRNVFVTPVGGAARAANLTPGQQFPQCYNIIVVNNSPTTWGTHLYFGGPGGVGC